MRIGIISDTHGVLRQEVIELLRDCEAIIHTGDIGDEAILKELNLLAPVYAVKGNNDKEDWAKALPERLVVTLEDYKIFIIHDIKECNGSKEYDIVVSGHSHKLKVAEESKQLSINPGSCGKKRFNLPLTLVKLDLEKEKQMSIHYIA